MSQALGVAPFDGAAATYDATFTATRLGRWLRDAVHARLATLLPPGSRVLELGCGTGEDAVWLAQRGVRVFATDASPRMVEMARQKAARAGVAAGVDARVLRIEDLAGAMAEEEAPASFDGALSNFGALNCVADLAPVARALARLIRPGGRVAFVIMGPWCPWEILWHAARGDLAAASRRLRRGGAVARVGDEMLRVYYPPPGQIARAFAPHFEPVSVRGIGVLLPPTYLGGLVERHPAAFERLARWEARIADTWLAGRLNDHYLIELRRTEQLVTTQSETRPGRVHAMATLHPRSGPWPPLVRRLWTRAQALRRPFVAHRHRRLVVETVCGERFVVLPDVFNPKLFRTGEILAQALNDLPAPPAVVLDMGAGAGAAAVFAAQREARVVAVDINPAAVRCVRLNALAHNVEGRIEARLGDLFAPVAGERFDLVLFNPPYFAGRPTDLYDHAWRATDVAPRFLAALAAVLAPGGAALVVLSSDADERGFLATAAANDLRVQVVSRRDFIHEVITVYRLTCENDHDRSV
ncbi:MAG: class I SAM-dependent methyltransferase [Anaerolineae bacterium]